MGNFLAGLIVGISIMLFFKWRKAWKKRQEKKKVSREEYCQNMAAKIATGFFAHLKGENVPHVWRKKHWVTQNDRGVICALAPLYLVSFVIAWDLYGAPIPPEVVTEIAENLQKAIPHALRERLNLQEQEGLTIDRFHQQQSYLFKLWLNRPPAPDAAKPMLRQVYAWMGEEGRPSPEFLEEMTNFVVKQSALCKDMLYALDGTVIRK